MIKVDRKISIAPMMDCTNRHFRYFARLLSQKTLLYTEMVTAAAIIHGDKERLLGFSPEEQPLALQVGGSDPKQLVEAAKIAEGFGYLEINLNVGCPSDRVQAGRFGACLMKEPELVAECVSAMQDVVSIPVTVKTRLGVDEFDDYAFLCRFIDIVKQTGCKTFFMHARKAWLKGLSPRQNREVPPLMYDRVYQLKRDYSELEIIINGGIKTCNDIAEHLQHVDGVMIGREAYSNPYLLSEFDQRFYGHDFYPGKQFDVVKQYLDYVNAQLKQGVPIRPLICFLVGLFKGFPRARYWRQAISRGEIDMGSLGAS